MLSRLTLTHNHWRRGHRSSFLEKKNSKKGLEKWRAKVDFRKIYGKRIRKWTAKGLGNEFEEVFSIFYNMIFFYLRLFSFKTGTL